jgi:hypothetical protein
VAQKEGGVVEVEGVGTCVPGQDKSVYKAGGLPEDGIEEGSVDPNVLQ